MKFGEHPITTKLLGPRCLLLNFQSVHLSVKAIQISIHMLRQRITLLWEAGSILLERQIEKATYRQRLEQNMKGKWCHIEWLSHWHQLHDCSMIWKQTKSFNMLFGFRLVWRKSWENEQSVFQLMVHLTDHTHAHAHAAANNQTDSSIRFCHLWMPCNLCSVKRSNRWKKGSVRFDSDKLRLATLFTNGL